MYRVVYSTGDPPMMGTKIVPAKNRDDAMNTVRNVLQYTTTSPKLHKVLGVGTQTFE